MWVCVYVFIVGETNMRLVTPSPWAADLLKPVILDNVHTPGAQEIQMCVYLDETWLNQNLT